MPVVEGGGRGDDEERTPDVVSLHGDNSTGSVATSGVYARARVCVCEVGRYRVGNH